MNFADIKAIHMIGRGLWAETDKARWMAHDSLATTTLLDYKEQQAADRIALLLLKKAENEGAEANRHALNLPFFRLLPEERFILIALHRTEWNYERLSNILAEDQSKIQEIAWTARLHLSSLLNMNGDFKKIPYPAGGSINGTTCPDYHPRRPWTQRFMDEELSKREQLFLQNHIIQCRHCARSIAQCRELYYGIESSIPTWTEKHSLDNEAEALLDAITRSRRMVYPHEHTLASSLESFMERWDVRVALALLIIFSIKLISQLF